LICIEKDKRVVEKLFEVALPEAVLAGLGWQETEVPRKLREMVVMELLRRAQLSEAEAATILQLDRWELLEMMGRYQVPAIRMRREELQQELARALPGDGHV
jgi:transcriptional regulator with GAF, ATPase, and Fis domain